MHFLITNAGRGRYYLAGLAAMMLLALWPASAQATGPDETTSLPWQPPTPAYKITITQPGIYQLTYADLAEAGLPLPQIDPHTFQIFAEGREIAIHVSGAADRSFDPQDSILFFAQPIATRYTNSNIYWLTFGHQPGQRIIPRLDAAKGKVRTSYKATARHEKNNIYISTLPLGPGHDHWYGEAVRAAGAGNQGAQTTSLSLNDLAQEKEKATLKALLAGNVTGPHHVQISINGQVISDETWSDRTLHAVQAAIPAESLQDGDNQITITLLNDNRDQPFDMIYVDWIEIEYQRQLTPQTNSLIFSIEEPGKWQYVTNAISNPHLQVFDITDPAHVQKIIPRQRLKPQTRIREEIYKLRRLAGLRPSSPPRLKFSDHITSPHQYLIVDSRHLLKPQEISPDHPSHLQDVNNQADYIIITHKDFEKAAQELAQHRTNHGLKAIVIDVQDIYDEFNGGLMSAEAIQEFLAYAYNHWQKPAPQYVLLLGDGTYDMRHYLPDTAPTYIPPYLTFVDTLLGEIASDNRYVAISGDDILPDMHIGRMPANTPAQAETMVHKTIAYETNPAPGDWNRNIIFVTDDLEGGGGDFYALADELATGKIPNSSSPLIPSSYHIIKIYAGKTCDTTNPDTSTECRQQIIDTLENKGALILNYIGHATKDYWATERLLDQKAIENLHTEGKWPITLAMSCVDGYFHQPGQGQQSFAEANIRAKGGSVASWSATSLGLSNPHQLLEKGFFQALFHGNAKTMGQATTAAKQYLWENAPQKKHYMESIDAYTLFGDPALHINLPQTTP